MRVPWLAALAALAAVAAAWKLTGGQLALDTNIQLATGTGPEVKGMSPGPYAPPCPAANVPTPITGKHPLLNHPKRCSPNLSAVQWDWLFNPPSEEDL
jgi:hypothetical protein